MKDIEVKKNLIKLYKIMYSIANSEHGKTIFSKELLQLIKIPFEDVETVLLDSVEGSSKRTPEIRQEIVELNSDKDATEFFKNNIWNEFASNEQDAINAFTAKELKQIYLKIVGIEIVSKKTTKAEVISQIIEYINSGIRTDDLAKGLF